MFCIDREQRDFILSLIEGREDLPKFLIDQLSSEEIVVSTWSRETLDIIFKGEIENYDLEITLPSDDKLFSKLSDDEYDDIEGNFEGIIKDLSQENDYAAISSHLSYLFELRLEQALMTYLIGLMDSEIESAETGGHETANLLEIKRWAADYPSEETIPEELSNKIKTIIKEDMEIVEGNGTPHIDFLSVFENYQNS